MELHGRKVTIMGLGRFGGGLGATLFALDQGARVTVTDLKPARELTGSVAALAGRPGVALHLGGHVEDDFREADVLVVSPAVPKDSPYLAMARQAGAQVTSEMNLFLERCPAPVVAVTGSAGKSTTATLLARALGTQHRVHFGGNIGRSLLAELPTIASGDRVCLELSSFQLEDAVALKWSPRIAVVTNLSPNHIDHHGSMEAYVAAKQNLLRYQTSRDVAVLPAPPGDGDEDDFGVSAWDALTPAEVYRFSTSRRLETGAYLAGPLCVVDVGGTREEVPLADALTLAGRHNAANFLAAALAARLDGVPLEETARATRDVAGLPHRLQPVAEVGGVCYVNDSKATTPAAARAALSAFDRPVVAIAGGYDKRIDLAPLADMLSDRARTVLLIGETASALKHLLAARGHPDVETPTTLDQAVARAARKAEPGDVVLLSPGHASWDQFASYEERGKRFEKLVHRLEAAGPASPAPDEAGPVGCARCARGQRAERRNVR